MRALVQIPRTHVKAVVISATAEQGRQGFQSTREPPRPSVSLGSLRDCVKKQGGETEKEMGDINL